MGSWLSSKPAEQGEEAENEEDRKEGWDKTKFLLYCVPITIILLLFTAIVILATILLMGKSTPKENAAKPGEKTIISIKEISGKRQRKLKLDNVMDVTDEGPDFYVDFVEMKMNFSDAAEYCDRKGATLTVLYSDAEEQHFLRHIEHNLDFFEECPTGGFIGYRMILEEELKVDGIPMVTFTGELTGFASMWLPGKYDPNKECAILIYHADREDYGLSSVSCDFQVNCYLCETSQGCPRDFPFCYIWRHKINQTESYTTANHFCMEKKAGHLARIRNKHMLDAMVMQLQTSAGKLFKLYSTQACLDGYYISKQQMDLGPLGFESIDEHQINYVSYSIQLDNQPFGAHCLGIRRSENETEFVPVRCDAQMCFLCRQEGRVTDSAKPKQTHVKNSTEKSFSQS